MTANSVLTHRNVGVLTVNAVEAPEVVTSQWIDDQLAETYERTGLKPGTLTELAGIEARRWWPEGMQFDEAAAMAGQAAIDASGIDPQRIGMLISTSVCKHHLEPSVACAVHHRLQLPPSSLNFDVGNACLGFINGMSIAAAAIDAGAIDYALIVDGEGSRFTQETTIARLQQPTTEAADVFAEFASLTLGSGAAAAVLGRADEHPDGHRILGGVTRAATQFHELCVGSVDGMFTDAKALLKGGLDLVVSAWKEASTEWDWSSMDRYITHQVSSVHTNAIVKAAKLDRSRVPVTFPKYGNVGPASIPITLVEEQATLSKGDRVLLMGVGSGLNTAMMELAW